jgi:hypothetical protein
MKAPCFLIIANVASAVLPDVVVDAPKLYEELVESDTVLLQTSLDVEASVNANQELNAGTGKQAPCCEVPVPPFEFASSTFKYNVADFKVSTAPEHKYQARRRGITGPMSEVGTASSLVDLTTYDDGSKRYQRAIDALMYSTGINGLRMPIIPLYTKPSGGTCQEGEQKMDADARKAFDADGGDCSQYMNLEVHEAVYKYAKEKNLVVFASPMPDTNYGWTNMKKLGASTMVKLITDYVQYFVKQIGGEIHFLDPWNEDYLNSARANKVKWNTQHIQDVTSMLQGNLTQMGLDIKITGPSEVMISKSEGTVVNTGTASLFDVIGAHTQTEDVGGTVDGWKAFMDKADGKPVWNTEGMTDTYDVGVSCTGTTNSDGELEYSWCDPCEDPGEVAGRDPGARPGLRQAVEAGVQGWVHWCTTGGSGFVKPAGGHLRDGGRGRHIMLNLLKKTDAGYPEACDNNPDFWNWWEDHKANNDYCSPCPDSVNKAESCAGNSRKKGCYCRAFEDIRYESPCDS